MKRKSIIILIIILEVLLLAGGLSALAVLHFRNLKTNETTVSTTTIATTTAAPATTAVPTTVPETTVPPTTTEPEPIVYTLSFAGDCTLGNHRGDYGSAYSFMGIVGQNYDYPFANVLTYFGNDDFTFVNFEGTLTESRSYVEKSFNFHAPADYAKILPAGSIEMVTLSNNHAYDYGYQGYVDTQAALDAENIPYVGSGDTYLYTTESGLIIGVYANAFFYDAEAMAASIASLREQGAEIVVVAMHWGIERDYYPSSDQIYMAHAAIDAGADIVAGHHPHVLQPMEAYNGGVIYYSLGNFSFGGNYNPSDKDSVVVQQQVLRDPDGTVRLGETIINPCSITSEPSYNNYQPTPLEPDSDAYARVLVKLGVDEEGKLQTLDQIVGYTYGYPSSSQSTTTQTTPPPTTTPPTTTPPETAVTTTPVTTSAAPPETTVSTTTQPASQP